MRNKFSVAIIFIILFSFNTNAQELKKEDAGFREFYSIQVSGLKSEEQARQLIELVLKDNRFLTCSVDFPTNTIILTAHKGVLSTDIKKYTSQFDLVIKKIKERYSDKSIDELKTEKQ